MFKPREGPFEGQIIHRCRRLARVHWPAHHRQARRGAGMIILVHQRHGGQRRYRRLAHRQHVRIRAQCFEELDQIIDIVVEVEAAFTGRHQAGVAPIGDVYLVIGQQPLHRAAQQRGIMARHWRHNQDARITPSGHVALKILELAKGLPQHHGFTHRHRYAINDGGMQIKCRLAAHFHGVGKHFQRPRHRWRRARPGHRVGKAEQPIGTGLGRQAHPRQPGFLHLKGSVQHQTSFRRGCANGALPYRTCSINRK